MSDKDILQKLEEVKAEIKASKPGKPDPKEIVALNQQVEFWRKRAVAAEKRIRAISDILDKGECGGDRRSKPFLQWKGKTEFIYEQFAGHSNVPIENIKAALKQHFPEQCDDSILCPHVGSSTGIVPEWFHRLYASLDTLRKRKLLQGTAETGLTFAQKPGEELKEAIEKASALYDLGVLGV